MTQQATRQIALIALLATCMMVIAIAVAAGLKVQMDTVVSQALPLVLVCAAALAVLFYEPADRTR